MHFLTLLWLARMSASPAVPPADGWRNLKWGMAPGEVKLRLEGEGITRLDEWTDEEEDALVVSFRPIDLLVGQPTRVDLRFSRQARLEEVMVSTTNRHLALGDCKDFYAGASAYLREKYGPPTDCLPIVLDNQNCMWRLPGRLELTAALTVDVRSPTSACGVYLNYVSSKLAEARHRASRDEVAAERQKELDKL